MWPGNRPPQARPSQQAQQHQQQQQALLTAQPSAPSTPTAPSGQWSALAPGNYNPLAGLPSWDQ